MGEASAISLESANGNLSMKQEKGLPRRKSTVKWIKAQRQGIATKGETC